MVRFPYRSDRMLDGAAWTLAPSGSTGSEVPEARPEVSTAEDGVRHQGEKEDQGDCGAHRIASSWPGVTTGARGPYGVSSSVKPPARRKRLLIPRRTRTVVIPTVM